MDTRRLTREMLGAYRQYLCMEERSQGTIDKYMRDIPCALFEDPAADVSERYSRADTGRI